MSLMICLLKKHCLLGVNWKFNKFMINEQGELVAYFGSKVKPMSEEITSKL